MSSLYPPNASQSFPILRVTDSLVVSICAPVGTPAIGQFRFPRVPFGLAIAPSSFQRAMTEIVFQRLVGFVFIDDINEFIARLRLVLQQLQGFNIFSKALSASWVAAKLSFWVLLPTARAYATIQLGALTSLRYLFQVQRNLRSFMGLGNFRDFVLLLFSPNNFPSYSMTARPVRFRILSLRRLTLSRCSLAPPRKFSSWVTTGAVLFQIHLSLTFGRWQIQELESFAIIHAITTLVHFLNFRSYESCFHPTVQVRIDR